MRIEIEMRMNCAKPQLLFDTLHTEMLHLGRQEVFSEFIWMHRLLTGTYHACLNKGEIGFK